MSRITKCTTCMIGIFTLALIAAAISNVVSGETINNDILLFAEKRPGGIVHLEWVDLQNPPTTNVFKVYRSTDPATLGIKLSTTNGYVYDDTVPDTDLNTYYYQIVRVN